MNGPLSTALAYIGVVALALALAVLATVLFALARHSRRGPTTRPHDLDLELQHKYFGGIR